MDIKEIRNAYNRAFFDREWAESHRVPNPSDSYNHGFEDGVKHVESELLPMMDADAFTINGLMATVRVLQEKLAELEGDNG